MLDYLYEQRARFLVVLAVFVVVAVVETIASRNSKQVPLKDRLLNVCSGVLFLVVGGILGSLVIKGFAQLKIVRPSNLDTVSYVILFVLFQDLVYYFYHRLQHSWSFLWGLHKLHHTDTDVNITTSHRTHLLEQPIQMLLIFMPGFIFFGVHSPGSLYAFYFGLVFLYLSHSRLDIGLGPLAQVFVGPQFHRIHHSTHPSHLNRNFAQLFSFYDRLFGTYSAPQRIGSVDTGIEGCNELRDQWRPIVWPLSLIWGSDRSNLDPRSESGN
jgi:sterol desaturase/sphingolipid hydroxylase (fatty acid hydroxylase superfamily)